MYYLKSFLWNQCRAFPCLCTFWTLLALWLSMPLKAFLIICTSVMLWVLSFDPILYAGDFDWGDVRVSWLFGCSHHRHHLCVWHVLVASDAYCPVHQCSISSAVQVFRVFVSSCLATINCLGGLYIFLLVHRSNL